MFSSYTSSAAHSTDISAYAHVHCYNLQLQLFVKLTGLLSPSRVSVPTKLASDSSNVAVADYKVNVCKKN